MLSKNVIKDIQSLGHKKYRDEAKLFVAEGPKVVNELLTIIPSYIQNIYATEEWSKTHPAAEHITIISESELERLSFLKNPNQVLAVINFLESNKPGADSFTLYLDTIQDPGNFGTIVRTADWFGVQHIVCSPGCADIYNHKVVQATMASLARVNVYYDEDEQWLQQQKVPVYAAVLEGNSLYNETKTSKGILIIGNESKGISSSRLELASHKITIPKKGKAESLNAGVATGIMLSHLLG